jgi:hypothetical protein
LLSSLVMPAGTTIAPGEPSDDSGSLARPPIQFWVTAQVDRPAFWISGVSPDSVIGSINANLPTGAKCGGVGLVNRASFVICTLPLIHGTALGPRQLVVMAAPLTDGTVGVRADAQVQYVAPRPYRERIPRQAHLLEITIRSRPGRLASLRVTSLSKVRALATVVNALPFAGAAFPGSTRCPGLSGAVPVDTFTFRARAGQILASVTEAADTPVVDNPCETASLRIRGHREPQLQNGGLLLQKARAVLGVTLARR